MNDIPLSQDDYVKIVRECRIAGILLGEIHPDADELAEIKERKARAASWKPREDA